MNSIYVFSGPCGCGKSTLADAYAEHLVARCGKMQVYVIHGDDFHAGFVETTRPVGAGCPGFLFWEDILRFNWSCLLSVAGMALARGLDVIIDYVVEDELPLLRRLAREHGAQLHYVVLTAGEEDLRRRLTQRGSTDLIERSLFLKNKLDHLPDNRGHLYDNSAKTPEQTAEELDMARYTVAPD